MENQRILDDGSLRLIATMRADNLLTDLEWAKVKRLLKEALDYLSYAASTPSHATDGKVDFGRWMIVSGSRFTQHHATRELHDRATQQGNGPNGRPR
jgi:hypothetical protein